MSARRQPSLEGSQLRIDASYIERFLEENRISIRQIERGDPVWPTPDGKVPLNLQQIERLIAEKDPVVWAWMNLVEREPIRDPDTGEVLIPARAPWGLFPIQAQLARLTGNLIVECGSEVGKTRDIILGTLWEMDTCPGESSLIGADSDITIQEIWSEIEYQLEANPAIGKGVVDSRVKPYREKVFANGARFQMRLCGHDGKQFRGGHFTRSVRADEATKWKNPQQWAELWRAAKPGAFFRAYSTPDGDYSSPFYAMCEKATPIIGGKSGHSGRKSKPANEEEPHFRKVNISKRDLPPPFWSERRAEFYRQAFGGEQSPGWQTNVEGRWGTPSYSVFPMPTLRPNLRNLSHYRMVVAVIDRETASVLFSAARLSPELGLVDSERTNQEEMLARERMSFLSGRDLGKAISSFFPPIHDWISPRLYCGGDLGSAQDPTELLFQRVVGKKWIDVFRVHLQNADWPEQAQTIAHLDHVSGHQVKYGFDNGSAGSALVQVLTQMEEFRSCPVCSKPVYFEERLQAFGFGDYTDEIDIETGEPLLNPDRKDRAGEPTPHRLSNKEFSTRVLERKLQAVDLEIACDAGAGHHRLSGPQLLVNHTVQRVTKREERVFRAEDDHHVDARRQAALAIMSELRGEPFVSPDPALIATAGRRPATDDLFGGAGLGGSVSSAFTRTGGVGAGMGRDW